MAADICIYQRIHFDSFSGYLFLSINNMKSTTRGSSAGAEGKFAWAEGLEAGGHSETPPIALYLALGKREMAQHSSFA